MARHCRRNEGKARSDWAPATDRSGPRGPRRSAPRRRLRLVWLACGAAALANPAAARRGAWWRRHAKELAARPCPACPDILTPPRSPAIAVSAAHRGVALKAAPIDASRAGSPAQSVLVMLDHVTDPQNVGAVFRSAAFTSG